jgi:hypothetical protein
MLRLLGVETGENALAPGNVIPGRGLLQSYGQWGFTVPANGSPVGATLRVPCRPRDRMGLRGLAGQHARYQRQRDVHRIPRYALDWRRFYGAAESGTPHESRLLRKAHRAGPGDGRVCGALGNGKSTTLSGASFFGFRRPALTLPRAKGHHFAVTGANGRLGDSSGFLSPRGRICRKPAAVVCNEA